MGEVDLDFKWAISLRKSIPPSLLPSHKGFSKTPTASSMLNLSRGSEDCLAFFFCQKQGDCDFQFKSHRMRKIFRSVLTFCYEIIRSGKHHPLKNSKCLRSLEYDFQTQLDKIIVGWKAIHHHRANPNPHQRGSCTERKSALHHPSDRGCDPLLSRASGAAALDAICTHSAEFGFCPEFEPDLSRVCQFFKASRLKAGVCQCVTHRTAEPTVSQICSPKRCYCPLVLRGLSKRKDMSKDFFTMEDKKQRCNGIITFEEAYRYQKS